MIPLESKVDGVVKFQIDDKPETTSPPYDAVLHLFECQYDEDTSFWFGVADVGCRAQEVQKVNQLGPGQHFTILIDLADGRIGAARQLNAEFLEDTESEHTRMAFIGWTQLAHEENSQ